MQPSIRYRNAERPSPTDPTTSSRLRTVTGNRFPRKCACGCAQPIPRDPEVRYVVDFGAPRPYPAYLREHSPDFGSPFNRPSARKPAEGTPAFILASAVGAPDHEIESPDASSPPIAAPDPSHADSDA